MRNNRTFGQWLRQKRGRLSLRAVEEQTRALDGRGLSDTHLCHIEGGKRAISTVSPRILKLLANLYHVRLADMVQWVGPNVGFQLSFDDVRGAKAGQWEFKVRPPGKRRRRRPQPGR
jgi:hypothetical protein